ncbi:hypothetical protein ACKVEX_05155 [Rhodocyclaceae bacterium SMB388]
MVIVQGVSDTNLSLEALFGASGSAQCFSINGWQLRIKMDRSHVFDQQSDGAVVIRDRPRLFESLSDESLNGAFLVLRPHKGRCLEIVQDRLASIPVYFAVRNGVSYFSSRLVDLVRAGWRSPDPLGVMQWVCLGQPLGLSTPVLGVQALPGAHTIRCEPGREPISCRYWQIGREVESAGRVEDFVDETVAKLESAHRRAKPDADARLALPVTGGLDSRCNLAIWAGSLHKSVLFHTQDLGNFELPIAREISDHYGKDLVVYDSSDWLQKGPVLNLDEESGEFNAGHWRLVDTARRLAEEHGAEATIDGFFQDFLFKASFVRDDSVEALLAQQTGIARYRARMLGFQPDSQMLKDLEASIDAATDRGRQDGAWAVSQDYYLENRSRRLVYNIVRLNQNYLDVRTPGLDHELSDFAFRLPKSLRTNALLYRHVIAKLSPALATIRYDKSGLPLLDMRRRSLRKKVLGTIKRNLNHVFPNRSWMRESGTNFSRLFAHDVEFRHRLAKQVDRSEWVRELFGQQVVERLDAERRKGRPSEDLVGALVTLAALEHQGTSGHGAGS